MLKSLLESGEAETAPTGCMLLMSLTQVFFVFRSQKAKDIWEDICQLVDEITTKYTKYGWGSSSGLGTQLSRVGGRGSSSSGLGTQLSRVGSCGSSSSRLGSQLSRIGGRGSSSSGLGTQLSRIGGCRRPFAQEHRAWSRGCSEAERTQHSGSIRS